MLDVGFCQNWERDPQWGGGGELAIMSSCKLLEKQVEGVTGSSLLPHGKSFMTHFNFSQVAEWDDAPDWATVKLTEVGRTSSYMRIGQLPRHNHVQRITVNCKVSQTEQKGVTPPTRGRSFKVDDQGSHQITRCPLRKWVKSDFLWIQ